MLYPFIFANKGAWPVNNIDICNLALSYIGKGMIDSLEERNENARQCKLHYDYQRQMLLRDYDWGFARRITNLAEVNAEIPGWKYVYKYPAKCLAIRRIFPQQSCNLARHKDEYTVMIINESDKVLCCNKEAAQVEYTYDITNADLFPNEFNEALARALAAALAIPLSGSNTAQQTQYQLMQLALNKAHVSDAKEQEWEQKYYDDYINARR